MAHPDDKGRIAVPAATIERLAPHATKRKITIRELVNRILASVATDDLVDAVLDDKEKADG